jgi:hypothetical protein
LLTNRALFQPAEAKAMTDTSKPTTPDRRLADIVRDVKISAADRTDVVVDMRDADRARLELLAQELQPVIDDIDPADDRFRFRRVDGSAAASVGGCGGACAHGA